MPLTRPALARSANTPPRGYREHLPLISGLAPRGPEGIAVSGRLRLSQTRSLGTIGEYTTSGATVNAALMSGLNEPFGGAMSGSYLFITSFGASFGNGDQRYATSGATVNAALVTGLFQPVRDRLYGSDLFVADRSTGTILVHTAARALR